MIGKIPFKPKRGFVLPRHRFTGPYNPLHLQLDSKDNSLPGNEPHNAVYATSMRHDICYRDNPAGKSEYDRKMLAELNTLVPKGRREKVDRLLVRSIIGLKHRLGMGVWSNQLANELHKPVRRRFDKHSVFAKQVDDIWVADLVDMSPFFRSNKGYKYLLTVIDVYSKYGWIVQLKTKTGKEVAQAFRRLFRNGHPSRFWTDKCMEFYNRQLKGVLEANDVMLYSTENEDKSSVVERWNRTMKNIVWKYFTANSTQKYIDVLPSVVDKYNSIYHRSIKLTPSDARYPSNYQHVYNALHGNVRKSTSPKFHVGDKVRITRKKGTFEKGFTPNWTEELFTISSVKATNPTTYTIKDQLGEPVRGSFYEQELQLSVQEIFRIERVLRKKKNQVYVQWKGYSNAFNSWIPVADLEA